jgi:hypothetical protein
METKTKLIAAGIVTLLLLVLGLTLFNELWHSNDDQNWQVVQSVSGEVTIQNEPGWYFAPWARIWTWPKASDTNNFESKAVTFNDGGWADMKGVYRFRLPTITDRQRLLHREFSSAEDGPEHGMLNIEAAIVAHLNNCLKNTGPMMSSSEYQTARKGEFYRHVDEQFRKGLYQTKKVERFLIETNEKGEPIKVIATEIVTGENGQPIVNEPSPLLSYGIEVTQFSISEIKYDDKTMEQFATKKAAFLAAENSKAQREAQIAERLMVEERGKKEKAEVEAQANKEKATAIIKAQQMVEVASAQARQAEEAKKQAITEAQREKEVAQLRLDGAKLDAEGVKVKAAAEEERIKKAGALTEEKRVLAEIDKERHIGVAQALASVRVPSTYIVGTGAGSDSNSGLFNLVLMRAAGLISTDSKPIEK